MEDGDLLIALYAIENLPPCVSQRAIIINKNISLLSDFFPLLLLPVTPKAQSCKHQHTCFALLTNVISIITITLCKALRLEGKTLLFFQFVYCMQVSALCV